MRKILIIGKSGGLIFACFRALTDQKMPQSGFQIMRCEEIRNIFWVIGQKKFFLYSKKWKKEEKPEKRAKLSVIPDMCPWGTLGGLMTPKSIWVI